MKTSDMCYRTIQIRNIFFLRDWNAFVVSYLGELVICCKYLQKIISSPEQLTNSAFKKYFEYNSHELIMFKKYSQISLCNDDSTSNVEMNNIEMKFANSPKLIRSSPK